MLFLPRACTVTGFEISLTLIGHIVTGILSSQHNGFDGTNCHHCVEVKLVEEVDIKVENLNMS